MSDSEESSSFEDTLSEEETSSQSLKAAAESLKARKPEFLRAKKTMAKARCEYTTMLNKLTTSEKKSARINNSKDIKDLIKDVQTDIANVGAKFDTLAKCLTGAFNKIESLESEICTLKSELSALKSDVLEMKTKPQASTSNGTYSAVLQATHVDRINKLEFQNSEDERRNNSSQVLITHSSLNKDSENPVDHVKIFLRSKIRMENREIDANMTVRRAQRENTFRITFSHPRFKGFLYKAKKNLRLQNDAETAELYINDHLTALNYQILMGLKKKRKTYSENTDPFKSLYTHNGRIFMKLKIDGEALGKHIKTREEMTALICSLPEGDAPTTDDAGNQSSNPSQSINQS